jgi:hypothetical protein
MFRHNLPTKWSLFVLFFLEAHRFSVSPQTESQTTTHRPPNLSAEKALGAKSLRSEGASKKERSFDLTAFFKKNKAIYQNLFELREQGKMEKGLLSHNQKRILRGVRVARV